ncbi:hypothetical protein H7J87_12375 [Mycolicibacterium wolinskyi]|uniref:ASCH domain-containing protein n=1 Tax=Mycolicibacterium wolinskyi TaxID=59750 RepID=A0A1X2FJE7_9MYCO|nr:MULTISPECIES: hypothetical protein [Mycolicibacterium]MCV7286124.1 hypothetical protein [Mycolicibacterium wolinskyi]MCV7296320.1 hypothetical protein [Mycolicibacterium goodii]ORX18542.1 hypothetical protein AWC31_14695 [Mycolicibacterium wolinskyi]
MARLMSVALTTEAVRRRQKTVTRRVGWQMLRPGDQLTLCPKVRGRRRGEPLDRIVTVDVVSVRREPLSAITTSDVTAEGFPEMTPADFIDFFCSTHHSVSSDSEITRIQWTYPRLCRQCGCTEYSACVDPLFGPCAWRRTYADNTGICTSCPDTAP